MPEAQAEGATRALPNFVNRIDEIKQFEESLVAAEQTLPTLMNVYGPAGEGKSWLLQKMLLTSNEHNVSAIYFDMASDQQLKFDIRQLLIGLRNLLHEQYGKRFNDFDLRVVALHSKQYLTAETDERQTAACMRASFNAAFTLFNVGLAIVPFAGLAVPASVGILSSIPTVLGFAQDWFTSDRDKKQVQAYSLLESNQAIAELKQEFFHVLSADRPNTYMGSSLRATLFLDGYDELRSKDDADAEMHADDHLIGIVEELLANRVMVVLAGRDQVKWENFAGVQPVGIQGLTRASALDLLTSEALHLPEELCDTLLEMSQTGQNRHHCLALALSTVVIKQYVTKNNTYPPVELFRTIAFDASSPSEVVDQLIQRFTKGLSVTMRKVLDDLSLLDDFDKDFALTLVTNGPRKVVAEASKETFWNRLLLLAPIYSSPVQPGFFRLHEVLKLSLRAKFSAEELAARAYDIHTWSFEYWINRAAVEADGNPHYSLENESWKSAVQRSLYYLCLTPESKDQRKALVSICKHMFNLYWWWADTFQYDIWDELIATATVALSLASANPASTSSDLAKAMALFRKLNDVWPKGMYKSSYDWNGPKTENWSAELKSCWSWSLALETATELRTLLSPPGKSKTNDESHVAAMADYYVGVANFYLADATEHALSGQIEKDISGLKAVANYRKAAAKCFERQLDWFAEGGKEPDPLKCAFTEQVVAKLMLTEGKNTECKLRLRTALDLLKSCSGEEGAVCESVSDGYTLLADSLRSKPEQAGKSLGRSLAAAMSFCLIDHDNYTDAYFLGRAVDAREKLSLYLSIGPAQAQTLVDAVAKSWRECDRASAGRLSKTFGSTVGELSMDPRVRLTGIIGFSTKEVPPDLSDRQRKWVARKPVLLFESELL